jgi:hypothetical protein
MTIYGIFFTFYTKMDNLEAYLEGLLGVHSISFHHHSSDKMWHIVIF